MSPWTSPIRFAGLKMILKPVSKKPITDLVLLVYS